MNYGVFTVDTCDKNIYNTSRVLQERERKVNMTMSTEKFLLFSSSLYYYIAPFFLLLFPIYCSKNIKTQKKNNNTTEKPEFLYIKIFLLTYNKMNILFGS